MASAHLTSTVNDVHSRLNPTAVAGVARPRSLEALRELVRAASARRPLALCGGRHSMGGQQFSSGGLLVDTSRLDRVLSIDEERGLVEAEAGIRWPALIDMLRGGGWSIRQKQAGADDLTLGGAVAANAHGRGLTLAPFSGDVERLTVVCPGGVVRTCSRSEHAELFRLVCGGYGLFGAVYAVTLRLDPRRRLRHSARLVRDGEVAAVLDEEAASGCLHGEVLLEIDPASAGYLRRGVLSYQRPVENGTPLTPGSMRDVAVSFGLARLAHSDKARWFALTAERALACNGSVVDADALLVAGYPSGYHWPGSSEMLTELFVPRPALAAFLETAACELRARETDVVGGTIRVVERDDETLLAWAREPWACVSLDLHVEHDAVAVGRAADACRALIDVALDHGGSYHLAYHRWARRDQVEAAHPRIRELIEAKRSYDPLGVLQSDWYGHLLRLLDLREAA